LGSKKLPGKTCPPIFWPPKKRGNIGGNNWVCTENRLDFGAEKARRAFIGWRRESGGARVAAREWRRESGGARVAAREWRQ